MNYNVIIIGGGTSGCACAYIAGKLGLKVLIIEKNDFLGGTMTSSLVTPAMKTVSSYNTDFIKKLTKKMAAVNGQITYSDGNFAWFNPELLKIVLDDMMKEAGVDILFSSEVENVVYSKKNIKSVKITSEILSEYIETNTIVDATGNLDFSKKINCNFINNSTETQPVNLRFIISGVDITKFSDWILNIDSNRDVTTSCNVNGEIHLSTAYTWDTDKNWALRPFFEDAIKKKIIKCNDSNYFQLFTIPGMPGSVAFNAPRIILPKYNDVLNPIHRSKMLQEGRKSIQRIAMFCKTYLRGFENSYISSIANTLGIRVSRRIKGKYIYTIDDLKSGKSFDNPCLKSDYPIDIHSVKKNTSVLDTNNEYTLPIEALMSADFDNLFVIGRGLSADFKAQAALRIIPSCFSMGEAVAKYIAKLLK